MESAHVKENSLEIYNTNILLKTKGITKSYRQNSVLEDISLTFERGRIYGLIGLNGAGKSTFLRILSGLNFQTKGEIFLYDNKNCKMKKATLKDCIKLRERMGSIIEYPSLYLSMSALDNMKLQSKICNKKFDKKTEGLLEKVNLFEDRKKKVKNFSLGMKQRLGIAMALVNDPEILILDEPINGLDPIGIIEIRKLLLELNKKGVTIIISSHILAELYQLASDFIFIDKGRILNNITKEELEKNIIDEEKDLENYFLSLLDCQNSIGAKT